MSEFLGARISLISKSDIRYSGILHSINSEDSTVSLENVVSYGTEGRKGKPEEEIAPADQIYEYIVFRGSDVKDLRIEDNAAPPPPPAQVPNDPAILGARPRPTNNSGPGPQQYQQGPPQGPPRGPGPQGPPGPQQGFAPNMPMPPGGWGGPNGPSPRNLPYPPPPGWYPPQGPGFGPNGPGGPGGPPGGPGGPQWNNNFYPGPPQQFPGGPGGPPGPNGPPGGPAGPGRAPQPQKPSGDASAPPASADKPKGPTPAPAELEPKSLGQPPKAQPAKDASPAAQKAAAPQKQPAAPDAGAAAASAKSATDAAKAAVAKAMASLGSVPPAQTAPQGGSSSTTLDNLTRKVDEMRVNAANQSQANNRYNNNNNYNNHHHHNNHHNNYNNQYRGRGRGGHYNNGPRAAKVEVPDTDFDFASSNAKFNKEDVVKEAIAGGNFEADVNASAAAGVPSADASAHASDSGAADSGAADGGDAQAPAAYSKTRSFFDNISSEAKDRAAAQQAASNTGGRPHYRGEEQRKNVETFGQGSVDGGYRQNYRGRGRGRGRGGYNRGRGGNNNYRQNNNYNNNQQQQQQQ